MESNRFYIIIILLLIGTFTFYRFGRSVYMPVVKKFKEKETVESVLKKIQIQAFGRVQNDMDLNMDQWRRNVKNVLFIANKEEQRLDVYYRADSARTYTFLKTYKFTAQSGSVGPKLQEGDRQIPEGIYKIEYLNPNSSYYLSMKVNYPNAFDRKMAEKDYRTNLGGDIFIHGKSASIGCIAIGDKSIEELFTLVALTGKEKIEVIILPWNLIKKNKPSIPAINWSGDLYDILASKLESLDLQLRN